MLAPNTLLQNRYLVKRQLGQGGMGAVYEATDRRFDRRVALKESFFYTDDLRRAFEREARLLNSLRHPALPVVIDFFDESNCQFLVMDYVPGEDLAAMLRRNGGPFDPATVLGWADQLLGALEYLHGQPTPIVHRDIKPQNLKLTPDGRMMLLDFGLSKGSAADMSRYTGGASVAAYTPHYAPFEQIRGVGTDARSDLYSLGATLYHLLTGVVPPDALERASALMAAQPDPLRQAHEVNPRVPPAVSAALRQSMATGAAQRPATAADMRAALRRAAAGNVDATLVGGSGAVDTTPDATSGRGTTKKRGSSTAADPPPTVPDTSGRTGDREQTRGTKLDPRTDPTGVHTDTHVGRHPDTRVEPPPAPQAAPGGGWLGRTALVLGVLTVGSYLAVKQPWKETPPASQNQNASQSQPGTTGSTTQASRVPARAQEETNPWKRFGGPTDRIRSVAFSPDGRFVVAGSNDARVWVWEVESGRLSLPPIDRYDPAAQMNPFVLAVDVTRDGRYVVSGWYDHAFRIYEVKTAKMVFEATDYSDAVGYVTLSPDGTRAITCEGRSVRLREVPGGREIVRYELNAISPLAFGFSPNGAHVLIAATQRTVREAPPGPPVLGPGSSPQPAEPKERTQVVLRVVDLVRGSTISERISDIKELQAAAFSRDGRRALLAENDGTLHVWDLEVGSEVKTIAGNVAGVTAVALSPDGRRALLADVNSYVILYDLERVEEIRRFKESREWAHSLAFSADGRLAVSGGGSHDVNVWKLP